MSRNDLIKHPSVAFGRVIIHPSVSAPADLREAVLSSNEIPHQVVVDLEDEFHNQLLVICQAVVVRESENASLHFRKDVHHGVDHSRNSPVEILVREIEGLFIVDDVLRIDSSLI